MLTTDDFLLEYDKYSDEQLNVIHNNPDDYSPEAQEAARLIIQKRGGPDRLAERIKAKQTQVLEARRIVAQTNMMARRKADPDLIRKTITSSILPPEYVSAVIEHSLTKLALENEDRSIKPRTIVGSLLAIAVAGILGGFLCGLLAAYAPDINHKVQMVYFIGVLLLCYGTVKLFTRQSRKNPVVIIATVLAFLLSILVGQAIAPLLISLHP